MDALLSAFITGMTSAELARRGISQRNSSTHAPHTKAAHQQKQAKQRHAARKAANAARRMTRNRRGR